MKKLLFFAILGMVVAFSACKNDSEKETANSTVTISTEDSLSYHLGLMQSQGLREMIIGQLLQQGLDSTQIDKVFQGMYDLASKDEAYKMGIDLGFRVLQMAKQENMSLGNGNDTIEYIKATALIKGLQDGSGITDKAELEKKSQASQEYYENKTNAIYEKANLAQFKDWKKENSDFLKTYAKQEGVVSLPSGVMYKVIEKGDEKPGSAINENNVITCDYTGKFIDDSEFDSSKGRQPIQVNMERPSVIKGWQEVLKLMPKNATWEVVIPYKLGYGAKGMGPVKPFSTLIFTIETKEAPEPAQETTPVPAPAPAK